VTEPSRKKSKVRHVPSLRIVSSNGDGDSLQFMSTHPTKPALFDATPFARGRELPDRAHGWDKGGHSGRPALVSELMPHIKRRYGAAPKKTLGHVNSSLRAWWRLFDKYADLRQVTSLNDVDEFVHGALAIKEGFTQSHASFLVILNDARKQRKLHPLDIRLPRPTPQHTSVPEQEHIRAIAKELTRRAREMIAGWEKSDALVRSMNGWSLDKSVWTPGAGYRQFDIRHAHCTFRQACSELNNPALRRDQYFFWMGIQNKENYNNPCVAHFSEVIAGLYPDRKQAAHLLYLFLCKTGWNLETALDIDVEDYWRPHPTNESFAIVYSSKHRARGEYQRAASEVKPRMSAINLLKAIIARTEPLREALRSELNELLLTEKNNSHDVDMKIWARINELNRCIRSPWLHVVIKEENSISALNGPVVNETEQRLSTLIKRVNANRGAEEQLEESLKIGDFRDAYISAQYRRSNYSWIVAHLAAGHKNIRSLQAYLQKRQWKAHGEKTVRSFVSVLWDEIRTTKTVDPATLHALVQRGEITEEQRKRWIAHKDRTKFGTGCKNFTNPPKALAPEHKDGDGCRIQRCTLCPHAVIFDDSMDPLARRLAQLRVIKENVPLPSWYDSSWPAETEATEQILHENWAPDLVESRISHWLEKEKSTVHMLLSMEGEYAA